MTCSAVHCWKYRFSQNKSAMNLLEESSWTGITALEPITIDAEIRIISTAAQGGFLPKIT